MNLQKKLAARLLKVSPKKIRLDPAEMEQIKESITKIDVRGLLSNGVIVRVKTKGQSRGRARKIATQKTKGRQRGYGSRKGTKKTRTDKKRTWINKIRKQRELLQ